MLSAAGRIGHAFLKRDLGVAAATTRLDGYRESKWEWFKQKEVLLTAKDTNTFSGDLWEVSEVNGFYSVRF